MKSYTPLRYPGGKSKLFEYTKTLIEKHFESAPIYVEVYVGGAGLAMKLLSENIVSDIYINDFDYAVYCVWYSLKHHSRAFAKLIENADLTIDEWRKQKYIYKNAHTKQFTKLQVGFATFYLNRTNRSGIIHAGPIGGFDQEGNYKMDCRFNKKELVKIVKNIGKLRNRIHISNKDGYKFIQYLDKKLDNSLFYLDPPYVQRGPELYKNSFNVEKHIQLYNHVKSLKNAWFMTYDEDELIKETYKDFKMQTFELTYKVQTKRKANEYAIFSNHFKEVPQIYINSSINQE